MFLFSISNKYSCSYHYLLSSNADMFSFSCNLCGISMTKVLLYEGFLDAWRRLRVDDFTLLQGLLSTKDNYFVFSFSAKTKVISL